MKALILMLALCASYANAFEHIANADVGKLVDTTPQDEPAAPPAQRPGLGEIIQQSAASTLYNATRGVGGAGVVDQVLDAQHVDPFLRDVTRPLQGAAGKVIDGYTGNDK